MARKKKRKKSKRVSFKFGKAKKRSRQKGFHWPDLTVTLKILAGVVVLAGLAIGFIFLDGYVKNITAVAEKAALIKLVDVPGWVNETLKDKIYAAAVVDKKISLDETIAKSVQQDLEALIVWFKNVSVQTTGEALLIKGTWRRPMALIEAGRSKFYLDGELVALDFVPMSTLPIVKISGLIGRGKLPAPGQTWNRDDLAAAMAILTRLDKMDKLITPAQPLLNEIESIDVTNYNGRKNSRDAHIVLYAKDGTKIIWGAELGAWQRHLEATDEEKLAKLYGYYTEQGTVLGAAKYINLRDPQDKILLPIDKD